MSLIGEGKDLLLEIPREGLFHAGDDTHLNGLRPANDRDPQCGLPARLRRPFGDATKPHWGPRRHTDRGRILLFHSLRDAPKNRVRPGIVSSGEPPISRRQFLHPSKNKPHGCFIIHTRRGFLEHPFAPRKIPAADVF